MHCFDYVTSQCWISNLVPQLDFMLFFIHSTQCTMNDYKLLQLLQWWLWNFTWLLEQCCCVLQFRTLFLKFACCVGFLWLGCYDCRQEGHWGRWREWWGFKLLWGVDLWGSRLQSHWGACRPWFVSRHVWGRGACECPWRAKQCKTCSMNAAPRLNSTRKLRYHLMNSSHKSYIQFLRCC